MKAATMMNEENAIKAFTAFLSSLPPYALPLAALLTALFTALCGALLCIA
jgi:hypothetical protein